MLDWQILKEKKFAFGILETQLFIFNLHSRIAPKSIVVDSKIQN